MTLVGVALILQFCSRPFAFVEENGGFTIGPYDTALRVVFGQSLPSIVTRPCSSFFFRYRSVRETHCVKLLWQILLAFRLAIARWTCRRDEAGCAPWLYSSVVEDPHPKLGFDEDGALNCDAHASCVGGLQVQVTAAMLRLPHILYQVNILGYCQ